MAESQFSFASQSLASRRCQSQNFPVGGHEIPRVFLPKGLPGVAEFLWRQRNESTDSIRPVTHRASGPGGSNHPRPDRHPGYPRPGTVLSSLAVRKRRPSGLNAAWNTWPHVSVVVRRAVRWRSPRPAPLAVVAVKMRRPSGLNAQCSTSASCFRGVRRAVRWPRPRPAPSVVSWR